MTNCRYCKMPITDKSYTKHLSICVFNPQTLTQLKKGLEGAINNDLFLFEVNVPLFEGEKLTLWAVKRLKELMYYECDINIRIVSVAELIVYINDKHTILYNTIGKSCIIELEILRERKKIVERNLLVIRELMDVKQKSLF